MRYGLRWFIAEDDGTVSRLPATACERWFEGEALPAFRQGVREDGRLDVCAATRLAMNEWISSGRSTLGTQRRRSSGSRPTRIYFWWPTDGQLRALGTALLKRPPTFFQVVDLRAAVVTSGRALPDR
jgi:hypothetical protein